MTTLRQLHEAMRSYKERIAPLTTCAAWDDFTVESTAVTDDMPDAIDEEMDDDWVAYWLQVADGKSVDYEPGTGERAAYKAARHFSSV